MKPTKTEKPNRGTYFHRLEIKKVFEESKRNNAPCQRCGQAINYKAKPGTTGDSFECGHKLPMKTHPELAYDPANLGPEHRTCNRSAGAKPVADPLTTLGNQTFDW